MARFRIFVAKLIGIGAIAVVLVGEGCKKEQSTASPDSKSASEPGSSAANSRSAKPDFTLSDEELGKAFFGDKSAIAAGNAKYKGKLLEVNGTVNEAGSGRIGHSVYFILTGYKDKASSTPVFVKCTVAPDNEKKAIFGTGAGQEITVRGTCDGYGIFTVDLSDCTITQMGADPSIKISAEDYSKAFIADDSASKKLYEGKALIVEGTIVELLPKDYTFTMQGGKTADGKPVTVRCNYGYDGMEDIAGKNVGDKIKVRGKGGFMSDQTVWLESIHIIR